jgi:hypothetical protein
LFVGLAVGETVIGIRKWGLAGLSESAVLLAHLVLYALAGLIAVIAGLLDSRVAVLAFGAIVVVDAVMRWFGRRMTANTTG